MPQGHGAGGDAEKSGNSNAPPAARAHIASKATATCATTGPRTKSAVSRQLRPPHARAAQLSLMQSPPTTAAFPSTTKVLR